MWESPIYKFEEEIFKIGKIVKKEFFVDVTRSVPAKLEDPGKALMAIFKEKITKDLNSKKIKILDLGAGKLRNTIWFLQKDFKTWAVEFQELSKRLPDAKKKWGEAEKKYNDYLHIISPNEFIYLEEEFDIILLINVINVMPNPLERFALLSLCRKKIKDNGLLLWHNWRAKAIHPNRYRGANEFIDGHLMGNGPKHTFYVEYPKDETHEILYSVGFSYNPDMRLHNIPGNNNYSFVYNPTHDSLISKALDLEGLNQKVHDPKKVIELEKVSVLNLYIKELSHIKTDRRPPHRQQDAHKYHLLASRIFYEIFREQLNEPITEHEINQGTGRIDIVYRNRNKKGIFNDLRVLRGISCPEIIVECKNFEKKLTNKEFDQLNGRLSPDRGMLGFLLCRKKGDKKRVTKLCKAKYAGGNKKYIIVLDDQDLVQLADYKLYENEKDSREMVSKFIDRRISEIIN
jgi:hypothetical protein